MTGCCRPETLEDALSILSRQGAQVLAGGTDWMVKHGQQGPHGGPVLYIAELAELRQIAVHGGEIHIGAACTLTELLESPLVPDCLKQPLAQMASPAIRNIATIGGNLCNASPAADALPMLSAMDAMLSLRSHKAEERLPAEDFLLAPGKPRLAQGQLLVEIHVPLSPKWDCVYRKVGLRRANSLSKVSFCALSDKKAGYVQDVRIAFGAVAPRVVRSREAEKRILSSGHPLTDDQIQAITAEYGKLLKPIDDARSSRAYRREVSLRLLKWYLREGMNA